MSDFLTMGGYGLYVWGSYAVAALAIAIEVVRVRARHRAAVAAAGARLMEDAR